MHCSTALKSVLSYLPSDGNTHMSWRLNTLGGRTRTADRAKAWCLLVNTEASLSYYGGQGERLVIPYTRSRISRSGARANVWCLHVIHAEASPSIYLTRKRLSLRDKGESVVPPYARGGVWLYETGARAETECFLIHADAFLSPGGRGERPVPPYTRAVVFLSAFETPDSTPRGGRRALVAAPDRRAPYHTHPSYVSPRPAGGRSRRGCECPRRAQTSARRST
jgi:hypothetical protein